MIDVHADDYGYSINTSLDILDLLKARKLDSISIMPNMSAFEKSMELLCESIKDLPYLPLMSIHINVVEGCSLANLNNSSISNNNIIISSWGKLFIKSYLLGSSLIQKDLQKEIKEQIIKGQDAIEKCIEIAKENNVLVLQKGVRLDSHQHAHHIPTVYKSMKSVIDEEELEIEYIRKSYEPIGPFIKNIGLVKSYSLINLIKNIILRYYSSKYFKSSKMCLFGLMLTGDMNIKDVRKLCPSFINYSNKKHIDLELLVHPGLALKEEFVDEMNVEAFKYNSNPKRKNEKQTALELQGLEDLRVFKEKLIKI